MATQWKTTYLDNIAQYGAIDPFGSGPYGGTIWIATIAEVTNWTSTSLEDPAGTTLWEATL